MTSREPPRIEQALDVLDAAPASRDEAPAPAGRAPAGRAPAGRPPAGRAPHDEAGIADLFQARHVDLVRLATLLVGDQATAEDVVQDVFTKVYARAERLAENGIAMSYFRTAVLNGCRSVLRRRAIARRFGGSAEAKLWAEPAESPEATILLAEDRRQVLRALAALPRRQREALVLRYYQRLSEPEIAETMGISRGTVKSTLSRGLDALGDKLSKENGR